MFVVLFIIEELYEKERQDKINKKKDRLIDKQKEEIFEMWRKLAQANERI